MAWRLGRIISVGALRGQPVEVDGRRLVPVVWDLSVSLGKAGMPASARLIWTRPIAVEVTEAGGIRRVLIVDVAMGILLGLISVAALLFLADLLLRVRRRSRW